MDTDNYRLDQTKAKLRSEIRAVSNRLSLEKRAADSAKIRALLPRQPFWKMAATVLFFAPLPDELNLWPLLEETLAGRKVVALPSFDTGARRYRLRRVTGLEAELIVGRFGIREPAPHGVEVPLDDLDLALVPGVAFDLRGHRLGRGQGFYDRWLANFAGIKAGIAFEEQLVAAIPAGKQDVRMDFILTPSKCVKCDL